MKFVVSSSDFLKKLLVANGAVGVNNLRPILENFLFELDGDQLSITATDLKTSIKTKLTVNGSSSGDAVVPAKLLVDTLRSLPEQPVIFDLSESGALATLTSDTGKYSLACANPEEYPELKSPQEEDPSLELPADTLKDAIGNTAFAASNDELRLAMTGVFFNLDFNKIHFVSTDAHKLVRHTHLGMSSGDNSSFIVPKKSLNLLRTALPAENEIVVIKYNKEHVFFEFDNGFVAVRLIDAQYPNYEGVIPKDNPIKVTVDRLSLLNALKRISNFANKTTNQVIFNISQNSIVIEAQDIDFSNEATETISCAYDQEALAIGFSAKTLTEMLAVLDTDEIVMEMSSPNRACLLFPSEQKDNQDLLMLIMPVVLAR